jgi:acetylornithine deacetylase/succinyl-diaminopimelate desuccinylase-like protein
VPDQDPEAIARAVQKFVAALAPADAKLSWTTLGAEPPVEVPLTSRWHRAATRALSTVFDRPPIAVASGGSIPAVAAIKRRLGCDSVLMGFGLDDDRAHAPNEKFERRCFDAGIRAHAAFLAELTEQ